MSRALLTVALSISCLSVGHATTLKAFSLEDLATHASIIVEGTVLDVRAAWDGRFIFTDVSVEVTRCHKGDCEVETVEIRVLGGAVGDLEMSVNGAARFEPEEEVLLFLEPIGDLAPGRLQTTGMAQGKFRLDDENAEGPLLRRDPRVARLAGPDAEAAHALDLLPLDVLFERLGRVLDVE